MVIIVSFKFLCLESYQPIPEIAIGIIYMFHLYFVIYINFTQFIFVVNCHLQISFGYYNYIINK